MSAIVCSNHPKRQSTAQCLSCGRRLCALCVVSTAAGERCKSCAKGVERPQRSDNLRVTFPLWFIFLGGLFASSLAWTAANYAYLIPGFLVAVIIGVFVSLAVNFLSDEGDSFVLMAVAVADVVLGNFAVSLVLDFYFAHQIYTMVGFYVGPSVQTVFVDSLFGSGLASASAVIAMWRLRV